MKPNNNKTDHNAYLLERGRTVPSFWLPDASGNTVKLFSYKAKRNLCLFFPKAPFASASHQLLEAFSRNYRAIQSTDTEVLAVLHGTVADAAKLQGDIILPYPVLADMQAETTRKYLPPGYTGIFITDRYGELYYQDLATDESELPDIAEILERLHYIDTQCTY